MSIVTYENVDTPVFELDTMRYLFRDGLQGMWIDFFPDYAFADTDLTTPANPGEGIAGYVDRSPYGYDGTQSVITARPILGRWPRGVGRRNLLTHTETFDTSTARWLAQNITIQFVAAPDGSMTAVELKQGTSAGVKRLKGYFDLDQLVAVRGRVWLKAGSISFIPVRIFGTSVAFSANVDLEAGTTTAGMLTDKGDGWFELDTGSVALDGLNVRSFDFFVGDTGTEAGDGSSSIIVWHPDLRLASLDGPYQRVGSQYDVTEAGVPSVYYAHYDGADDVLPSSLTIPSISEGCFILVGTNGIWIDNEWTNTSGTLSVGPTTYTGGPAGILPVVGDVLSIIVRNEPLTDKERQKVIQAGVKRGSAGLIEMGPELVVNGDFSDGTVGWVGVNASIADSSGVLLITPTSTNPGAFSTTASGPAGAYIYDVDSTAGVNFEVRLKASSDGTGSSVTGGLSGFLSYGRWTGILLVEQPFLSAGIQRSPAVAYSLNNFSLRRLIMPGETP